MELKRPPLFKHIEKKQRIESERVVAHMHNAFRAYPMKSACMLNIKQQKEQFFLGKSYHDILEITLQKKIGRFRETAARMGVNVNYKQSDIQCAGLESFHWDCPSAGSDKGRNTENSN